MKILDRNGLSRFERNLEILKLSTFAVKVVNFDWGGRGGGVLQYKYRTMGKRG